MHICDEFELQNLCSIFSMSLFIVWNPQFEIFKFNVNYHFRFLVVLLYEVEIVDLLLLLNPLLRDQISFRLNLKHIIILQLSFHLKLFYIISLTLQ